ncbi:nucleotidyltransferase family protein [Thiothrix eikelboomii]|uniref:nucleotidyltransferase family protein n=1 Tax=Thiothrix eikelboomii TaxID=92487 RepID=UPI003BB1D5F8
MTKDEILSFLREHKLEMAEAFGVVSVGLFGSYARHAAREDSDIDIAVEFLPERKSLKNFMGFKRYLEAHMHKTVDLGIESTLKPVIRESVKKDIQYA